MVGGRKHAVMDGRHLHGIDVASEDPEDLAR